MIGFGRWSQGHSGSTVHYTLLVWWFQELRSDWKLRTDWRKLRPDLQLRPDFNLGWNWRKPGLDLKPTRTDWRSSWPDVEPFAAITSSDP